MNQEELYLFDLNGYLVIEDVLTQEEVATANQAIDQNLDNGRGLCGMSARYLRKQSPNTQNKYFSHHNLIH